VNPRQEKQADEFILGHRPQFLAELSRLCSQPSISAQGVGIEECADLVAEMLRARGLSVEIHPTAGNPIVYAEAPGTSARTLLLYNHYDVQPPEPLEDWVTPPFSPSVRDGRLFARGSSDDKGHILCRLAAVDAVRDILGELPCTLKFVIEGEEEISSPHLPDFVRRNSARLRADGCLWEFGGVDFDGVPLQELGMRGICYVELQVQTAACDSHSGLGGSIFPNAVWRLAWALATLKGPDERVLIPGFYDEVLPPSARDLELLSKIPDPSQTFRETYGLKGFLKNLNGGVALQREAVFAPTCTICGLTSGYQGPGAKTVIPGQACAKVDFRLVPNQKPEDILHKLRQHLAAEGFADVEVRYLGGEPPGRTDPDHPFVALVVQAARDVYGVPQRVLPMVGGSGPNHVFLDVLGVPIATVGVGYPGGRGDSPNEHVVLDNLMNGIRHTARVMMRLAEL
jgi:acetylornithine deacetylase/succinyl-diaminopimelate desuccinylase-like protein